MTSEEAKFIVDMYTMWRDQRMTPEQERLLGQAFKTLKMDLEAAKGPKPIPRVQQASKNAA